MNREERAVFFSLFSLHLSQQTRTCPNFIICLLFLCHLSFYKAPKQMSSSRATGSLLGRLAATAGAVMRRSSSINGSGTALGAIVGGAESSSSSASAMLLAGQRRPHATSSWTKVREQFFLPLPACALRSFRVQEASKRARRSGLK